MSTTKVSAAMSDATGTIVQVVNVMDGVRATGSTVMPSDDSIPQNTEGNQFMTLAITPTNSSNKLLIEIITNIGTITANCQGVAALFQDSTASALAAWTQYHGNMQIVSPITGRFLMTAGTTSATTFKVRAGFSLAATCEFNGYNSVELHNTVGYSSITITEIAV